MRKIFKQLHIWLSIPLGVVIAITCFSGAMLIFEKEITRMVQSDYYYVEEVKGEPLPLDELIARVEPTLEDGRRITGVTITDDPERSYQVNLNEPKRAAVFVDQYTGEVLGEPGRLEFFQDMFRLHRWLMDERPEDEGAVFWGKMIVGTSTLLMVIIILTGIVLWWPKTLKALKHRSKIALRKGWHRFWYDLHVAGGIYATLLLLAMALTGLTWSFEWYNKGFYKALGVDTEESGGGHSSDKSGGKSRSSAKGSTDNPYLHWSDVAKEVESRHGEFAEMTISKGEVKVKNHDYGNQRAKDTYKFDGATGEILAVELYADKEYDSKVKGWVYSVHVGSWGGIVTRIMWFLAAMLGATLPLTGYYLWIRRKFFKKSDKAQPKEGA
ncbi:MAG: PepSY domain-containing protein [Alistipes sp.]|nr:PepSY domain-containing protein [Alistipes sp.]